MNATTFVEIKTFAEALLYTQPRILAMFIVIPIFTAQLLPGMLKLGVAAGIGALVAPVLAPQVAAVDLNGAQILLLVAKEAFVGFCMGYLIALPFWAFEAIGFFIDNQRGASIASTLNPLTGNDTSPMGILFNQAFIVFFLVAGGMGIMLDILYDSFRLWNVFDWTPVLRPESTSLFLDQFARIVKLAVLLAAPAIVAMFLAEVGLALVSRFVPQLQVFFLAMPIKSGLALLVLIVYVATLFEYGHTYLDDLVQVVPLLDGQWGQR
jgi:type III secretion protein T